MFRSTLAIALSFLLISCAEVSNRSNVANQSSLVPESSVTRLVNAINDPLSEIYTKESEHRAYLQDLVNNKDNPELAAKTKEILQNYFSEINEATSGNSPLNVRGVAEGLKDPAACQKAGPNGGKANCPRVCAWGAGFGAAFACMTIRATACVKCGNNAKCATAQASGCVYAFAWAFAYACAGGGMAGVVGDGANACPVALDPADPITELLEGRPVTTATSK